MIARYSGLCEKCNQRIGSGADCNYSSATKRISHYACPENPDLFSESEAEDTAARCGFFPARELDGR